MANLYVVGGDREAFAFAKGRGVHPQRVRVCTMEFIHKCRSLKHRRPSLHVLPSAYRLREGYIEIVRAALFRGFVLEWHDG